MKNIKKDINFAENVLGFGESVNKLNFIDEFIKENNASMPSFTRKRFMRECADKYSKLSSEDRKVADDLLKKHRSYKSMQEMVRDKDSK